MGVEWVYMRAEKCVEITSAKMNFINSINSAGLIQKKDVKKISDLIIDNKYEIVQCKKVKTRYGPTVLVELIDYAVFLPRRFNDIIKEEDLEKMAKHFLIYKGSIECNKPNPAHNIIFE